MGERARLVVPLLVVLVLVACLAALLPGCVGSAHAADDGPATDRPLRIATYNINHAISRDEALSALLEVLPSADLLAAEEFREGSASRLRGQLGETYSFATYRFKHLALFWRTDRFDLVDSRCVLVGPGRYIGSEAPIHHGLKWTRPKWALVVHLRERDTGRLFSVVSTHLLAGAVRNGRPDPRHPRTFRAYRESVVNLGRLAREEASYGELFVLGDFNVGFVQDRTVHRRHLPYATFRRQGMRSMWSTQVPSGNRGSQTHGHSLIDQVYSVRRADSAGVRYDVRHGDHFPVVATYEVPAPAPTPSETPTPTEAATESATPTETPSATPLP